MKKLTVIFAALTLTLASSLPVQAGKFDPEFEMMMMKKDIDILNRQVALMDDKNRTLEEDLKKMEHLMFVEFVCKRRPHLKIKGCNQ